MPWPGPTGISDSERQRRDDHELQIFVEVLMTLALGRDVVVPQSYAFDSTGFLSVARTVLQARNRAAIDEHPFRIHLFGVDSFEDAIANMLSRTFDENRPFSAIYYRNCIDRNSTVLIPVTFAGSPRVWIACSIVTG
jgi:hypothetical protein